MKAPFLFAPLLVFTSVLPSSAQDWSLHTDALKKTIFRLQSGDSRCSAVLINDKEHVFLTAAHCVPDPEPKTGGSVTVDDNHAEVIKWNSMLDLALVRVKEVSGTAITIRPSDVKPGTPVMAVGHGFAALQLKHAFGWVSDPEDPSLREVGKKLYFSAVGVVGGFSGGAVIDTAGKLVTIIQAGVPQGLMVGAPTDTIKNFANDYWPDK